MLVTLSGIVMLVKLLQPENAPSLMHVTPSGIVTLAKLRQSLNAPFRRTFVFSCMVQEVIFLLVGSINAKYGFASLPKYLALS